MNKDEFKEVMKRKLKKLEIELDDKKLNQFYLYMNLLIKWNKIMNLTGIIEPEEIVTKHFIDSLEIIKYVDKDAKLIDVGTGAGFPGIPIKIVYPNTKVILLDSLSKRLKFLDEVIIDLNLENIKTVHGRAEDLGNDYDYREKFDIAVARAVAPLNILLEYLLPFVKVSGKCLCMKGANAREEIERAASAIQVLGGKLIETEDFSIPERDIKRRIIIINKEKNTNKMYPRKAGIPTKKPL